VEAGKRCSLSDVHAALLQRVGGVSALEQDPSLRHALQAGGQNRVEAWVAFTYSIHDRYVRLGKVGRPNMHAAGPVEATPGLGPEREH
jgi:hypothetical protein